MIKHVIYVSLLLCTIIVSIFPNTSNATSTRVEIAKKVFPSIALLVMEDSHRQPLSLGSGFFVSENILITNVHVVEGAASGYVKLTGEKKKYAIDGIVAIDSRRDLIALAISGVNAHPLVLGDSSSLDIGQDVFAIGNPKGLEGTFSDGIVSGIRKIGKDKIIQITAPISPGSSGGPIVNLNGEVIGVAVATFEGGQNLNFAIPSEYVTTLLKNKTEAKPLHSSTVRKAKDSIFGGLGNKPVDAIKGSHFIWNNKFESYGDFTFTLRNKLRDNVKNIYLLVIFYDKTGEPVELDFVKYRNIIPGGLAKRVSGNVDGQIKHLTTRKISDYPTFDKTPYTKLEFRVLDFEVVEDF